MRLIGYVRDNKTEQANSISIETQVERVKAYCKAYGYKLVRVFKDAASAEDMNRPVFQDALDHMHKVEANGLIALRLDCVPRSTRDVLALVEDVLKPEGKALILVSDNVDTSTIYGRFMLDAKVAFVNFERDVIRDRRKA